MLKKADLTYRTAIARKAPSRPARYLAEHNLIKGRSLDYGCGRGFDADYYGMDKYDPHFAPEKPKGKYDTILCTYVLCVLPSKKRREVLKDIASLLKKDGIAYISVRNDVKEETKTQFIVNLSLPLIKKTSTYQCHSFVIQAAKPSLNPKF